MANILNSVPFFKPKRNVMKLGHENRLSTDNFRLTPIAFAEAYPDDLWRLRAEAFVRISPLIAPIMHRFDVRTYWFFVPTRIIWDGFEEFMSGKPTVDSVSTAAPKITFTGDGMLACFPKTLGEYLSCRTGLAPEDQSSPSQTNIAKANALHPDGLTVSQLPFRVYQKVYNDWFLPGHLTSPNNIDYGNDDLILTSNYNSPILGEESAAELVKIRMRSWQQDMFTAALIDPQRGPEVYAFDGVEGNVQLSGNGSVTTKLQFSNAQGYSARDYDTVAQLIPAQFAYFGFESEAAAQAWVDENQTLLNGYSSDSVTLLNRQYAKQDKIQILVNGTPKDVYVKRFISSSDIANSLTIDGSAEGTAVSVEELRMRLQMQEYLERENTVQGAGNGRYTQTLYAHWGVKGRDGRLQRAEFIGSYKQPLMINEVSQLSEPSAANPLGQMAGQGVSSSRGARFKFRVPEHGYIIGLMAVTPRSAYMQGLPKYWTKFDRLDFYFPEFAHIGEEPIRYRELLNNGFNGDDIFGYQLRNYDLKVSYDECHGDMAGSLAHWSAARSFATPVSAAQVPKLSPEFVRPASSGDDDIDRIFPVDSSAFETTNADHYVADVYCHMTASRLMPKYSTPRVG